MAIEMRARANLMVMLRLRGMTLAEIGDLFHISRERVRQIMDREGVLAQDVLQAVRENHIGISQSVVEKEWAQGYTISEIARKCRVSSNSIRYWCPKRDATWKIARLLLKVNKDARTGCWVWNGCCSRAGYGHLSPSKYVHRVMWELCNGPIPKGLHVLHHCDNPPCCNPDHLFLGTHADNMHDRDAKGRSRWGPNRPSLQHKKLALTDICLVDYTHKAEHSHT